MVAQAGCRASPASGPCTCCMRACCRPSRPRAQGGPAPDSEGVGLNSEQLTMRMSTACGLVPVARSTSSTEEKSTRLASWRAVSMLMLGGEAMMAAGGGGGPGKEGEEGMGLCSAGAMPEAEPTSMARLAS